MSTVYNEVVLKEISVFHSCLFLWICITTYANYKSSHAVFYYLVSTCRLVVLKLFKTRQYTSNFFMIYGECDVVSLYVVCCSVNVSVCFVCCVLVNCLVKQFAM